MMERPVRTNYLFVASQNGQGTNERCTLRIPESIFECDNSEYMVITLEQHSMQNTLYNITQFCRVSVTTDDVRGGKLTPGFYTLAKLQESLNALSLGVAFRFDCLTNLWTVTTGHAGRWTVTLSVDLQRILGMSAFTEMTDASSHVAPRQSMPGLHNELILSLEDVSLVPLNLTNIAPLPADVSPTSITGIIPLLAPPGTLNVYTNRNRTFSARIFGMDVARLTIATTDLNGDPVFGLPPWTAVFRIDTYKLPSEDPVTGKLDALIRLVRLAWLTMTMRDSVFSDDVA